MTMFNETALVLFSGGQDSTTCLAWALENFSKIKTIGFDYGQRHRIELECRINILDKIKNYPNWKDRIEEDHLINLEGLGQISDTALTSNKEIAFEKSGLPNTFVPGRNLMFFTLAAALSYRLDIKHLVGGMCETDFSGYPDCRDVTLKALQAVLSLGMALGMANRFVIHTPLMWLNKKETWQLADNLGGEEFVDLIREKTHSCYEGDRTKQHAWGYGCGICPSCELRRDGWEAYKSTQGN